MARPPIVALFASGSMRSISPRTTSIPLRFKRSNGREIWAAVRLPVMSHRNEGEKTKEDSRSTSTTRCSGGQGLSEPVGRDDAADAPAQDQDRLSHGELPQKTMTLSASSVQNMSSSIVLRRLPPSDPRPRCPARRCTFRREGEAKATRRAGSTPCAEVGANGSASPQFPIIMPASSSIMEPMTT